MIPARIFIFSVGVVGCRLFFAFGLIPRTVENRFGFVNDDTHSRFLALFFSHSAFTWGDRFGVSFGLMAYTFFCLSLSLSLSLSHTLSHSLSHTHTRLHTRTLSLSTLLSYISIRAWIYFVRLVSVVNGRHPTCHPGERRIRAAAGRLGRIYGRSAGGSETAYRCVPARHGSFVHWQGLSRGCPRSNTVRVSHMIITVELEALTLFCFSRN